MQAQTELGRASKNIHPEVLKELHRDAIFNLYWLYMLLVCRSCSQVLVASVLGPWQVCDFAVLRPAFLDFDAF